MASFKMTGGDLAQQLRQAGGYITASVNNRMEAAMTDVRNEAIARCPVDEGNLEQAIKLQKGDYRRSWIVYVDESMPDNTGKYTVGDYALRIHEGLGWNNLGPKSLAKAAGNGKPVGRKFLENPFREIINNDLLTKLQEDFLEAVSTRRAAEVATRSGS